ncbi:putative serine protease K12H4.7 [Planococcus citri]|uniref:putative serine protease K12H4.7 n=1 Tax=Planococcus citri TaxID=170843 RepID=UPI0031F7526C
MFFDKAMNSIVWIFFISNFIFHSSAYFLNGRSNHGVGEPYIPRTGYQIVLPEDQYFEQKLDHFDPTNEDTWLQRYWRNPQYYKNGGPAFLMINGEATASPKWSVTGQWVSYAKTLNAIGFSLEHRFYGRSRPKNDTSAENLVYLSSEQALADIAYFIRGVTKQYALPKDIKWIVFGGSYAGSLAAWARLKYPYLIHGAVSSSGPLLAKVDFAEYFQVVKSSLDSYNSKCSNKIAMANQKLDTLVKTDAGREQAANLFQLCGKLENNPDDISSFFAGLADNFAGVVQYNRDNRESETKSITIETLCNIMTLPVRNTSALVLYAEVNKFMLKSYNLTCLDHSYKNYIDSLKKIDYESAAEVDRQWIYQTCTEFGFYQSSSNASDIFGPHFPAEFYTKQCEQIFGKKYDEKLLNNAVYRTNTIYGELKINVGNIVFVHGSVDPWHALGITHVQDEDAPYETIFIKGTAHCADMYPSSDEDTQELKEARSKIQTILQSWLQKGKPKPKKFEVQIEYKYAPNSPFKMDPKFLYDVQERLPVD